MVVCRVEASAGTERPRRTSSAKANQGLPVWAPILCAGHRPLFDQCRAEPRLLYLYRSDVWLAHSLSPLFAGLIFLAWVRRKLPKVISHTPMLQMNCQRWRENPNSLPGFTISSRAHHKEAICSEIGSARATFSMGEETPSSLRRAGQSSSSATDAHEERKAK